MSIVYLIIAIIIVLNGTRVRNKYVNYYFNFDTSSPCKAFAHFLGTFLYALTEGVCWWYIIKTIIENI